MIDIKLCDMGGKRIAGCGVGKSEQEEKEIFLALRNALLDTNKLLEVFGENK